LRLFWSRHYNERSQKLSRQVITTIQDDICCGFYAPLNCININGSFPSDRSTEGVPKRILHQRLSCGTYPGFYPQSGQCSDYIDNNAANLVVGGCDWDQAIGYCVDEVLTASTRGCLYYAEVYMDGLIIYPSIALIVSSILNFISIIYTCCLYGKRKRNDVFPDVGLMKVCID
jgi:hypothetical protein